MVLNVSCQKEPFWFFYKKAFFGSFFFFFFFYHILAQLRQLCVCVCVCQCATIYNADWLYAADSWGWSLRGGPWHKKYNPLKTTLVRAEGAATRRDVERRELNVALKNTTSKWPEGTGSNLWTKQVLKHKKTSAKHTQKICANVDAMITHINFKSYCICIWVPKIFMIWSESA